MEKVVHGDHNAYKLKDLEGEPIIGKSCQELSGVNRRREMVLVKWLGYNSKDNSWIPKSDIHNLVSMIWK